MPIVWICSNPNCFGQIRDERPHKPYRRKPFFLDNGKLDDDDELVVFSEIAGNAYPCEECEEGGWCRVVLRINRSDKADDYVLLEDIEEAVNFYKQNGWYPKNKNQSPLY